MCRFFRLRGGGQPSALRALPFPSPQTPSSPFARLPPRAGTRSCLSWQGKSRGPWRRLCASLRSTHRRRRGWGCPVPHRLTGRPGSPRLAHGGARRPSWPGRARRSQAARLASGLPARPCWASPPLPWSFPRPARRGGAVALCAVPLWVPCGLPAPRLLGAPLSRTQGAPISLDAGGAFSPWRKGVESPHPPKGAALLPSLFVPGLLRRLRRAPARIAQDRPRARARVVGKKPTGRAPASLSLSHDPRLPRTGRGSLRHRRLTRPRHHFCPCHDAGAVRGFFRALRGSACA